jgi:hypothetical protein
MQSHTLVIPFLTDNPIFAYGVEFGMLYVRMRDPTAFVIEEYCSRWLQEQITLAANRLGWRVAEMAPWDEHWFRCRLEKCEPPAPSATGGTDQG